MNNNEQDWGIDSPIKVGGIDQGTGWGDGCNQGTKSDDTWVISNGFTGV